MAKALRCRRERPVRLCPADNGGVRDFEFQDFRPFGNSGPYAWTPCNGHVNNVMWSTYCDNDTGNIVSTKHLVTGVVDKYYWHFHTYNSNTASNDFEFYFR